VRGLTPLEHSLLTRWVIGSIFTESEVETLGSLAGAGRLTRWDGGENWVWKRTQFAHLALRVCPVGEL
jgi:hypothetical protein